MTASFPSVGTFSSLSDTGKRLCLRRIRTALRRHKRLPVSERLEKVPTLGKDAVIKTGRQGQRREWRNELACYSAELAAVWAADGYGRRASNPAAITPTEFFPKRLTVSSLRFASNTRRYTALTLAYWVWGNKWAMKRSIGMGPPTGVGRRSCGGSRTRYRWRVNQSSSEQPEAAAA